MKNFFKKIIYILCFILLSMNNLTANDTYFIDFSKVLNQSKAGAEAQDKLKKKFETETKKFNNEEENIKKLESDLIAQKKIISNEEYQKKVNELRKRVASLQKNKQDSLNAIARTRAEAKQELLKAVNPIIKNFMEQKNIRLILDKQSVVLGDTNLEITNEIIEILNKELKSIKVN